MSRFRRSHGSPRGKGRSRVLSMIIGFGILLILIKLGTDQASQVLTEMNTDPNFQHLPLLYKGADGYEVGKQYTSFENLALVLLQKVDSMRQYAQPIKVSIRVPDTLGSEKVANLLRIVQATDTELHIKTYSTAQ